VKEWWSGVVVNVMPMMLSMVDDGRIVMSMMFAYLAYTRLAAATLPFAKTRLPLCTCRLALLLLTRARCAAFYEKTRLPSTLPLLLPYPQRAPCRLPVAQRARFIFMPPRAACSPSMTLINRNGDNFHILLPTIL